MQELTTAKGGYQAKDHSIDAPDAIDEHEELFHMQADGFWGSEKGFHDVEQFRIDRQSAH